MKKIIILFALLLMAMVYGQVPNISYASPQSYPVGSAITPLTPTNTGGAVVGSTLVSTIAGKTPGQDGTGTGAVFGNPQDIAIDVVGNAYVADFYNHKIRKISPDGVVTTLAGSGIASATDGMGTAASFYGPIGIAVDALGNVYVADFFSNKIRKISPEGLVTTLAGSGTPGATDGTGTAASFSRPYDVAVDASGNCYVADSQNHKIRKINTAGEVTTLAGSGSQGSIDGNGFSANFDFPSGIAVDASRNVYVADRNRIRMVTASGNVSTIAGRNACGINDGLYDIAGFCEPQGVSIDAAGNLYVADKRNNKIRKISPERMVTTLAGSGVYGDTDGTSTAARFKEPSGVAVDATGNVYVADSGSNKIRKISASGMVISWVGSRITEPTDGIGRAAGFYSPNGIAVDASGNVYVADTNNHKIRKITPTGVVSTLAGSGTIGDTDGTGTAASFNQPNGVATDATGNVYVADTQNHKIRKISVSGAVSTLAGSGEQDAIDGPAAYARFNWPTGVAVDAMGQVYVADSANRKIRKISPIGVVSTLAGSGSRGDTDGTGTVASFNCPNGVAVDASGHVYVADYINHKIRKISPTGVVSTLAGIGTAGDNDGTGTTASFNNPARVAVDALGTCYVADSGNQKIRKISPEGVVTTLAGSGTTGATDGKGTSASFNQPNGVATDAFGNVYIGDTGNHKIRKINIIGFRINPTLPAGLSFDETTGVISGTPTVASPLTTYTVTASNESGSTTTTLAISTAVLDNPSFTKESLSLFPNPAHNLLQIQTRDNLTIDRVIITDLTGKVILEQTLDANTINIAQLACGMYLIKAFSGKRAFTSKFMKAL